MNYDVIIIGLGAMGSSALFQLAKRGVKACGIDRFSPPHQFGSTHGETRVTRQAIGEGREYVPFALRSYQIFREIEAETETDLLTITGGLIISGSRTKTSLHGNSNFIKETVSTAQAFNIKHQTLTADELCREFPQFNLEGHEIAYYEDEMGFLRPEVCVKTQLDLAEKYRAQILREEQVLQILPQASGVEIITDKNRYSAEKAIVSAGAWLNNFLEEKYQNFFKVYRQIFYWFDVSETYEKFKLGNFPIFIWEFGRWENDFFYGFPAIGKSTEGFKMATETYFETVNPDNVNREILTGETADFYQNYVKANLPEVSEKCLKTATCLYTNTSNSRFLIDKLPENERIIVASPCSGHGFKHSAAIGETLAELVVSGKTSLDISAFSWQKFC